MKKTSLGMPHKTRKPTNKPCHPPYSSSPFATGKNKQTSYRARKQENVFHLWRNLLLLFYPLPKDIKNTIKIVYLCLVKAILQAGFALCKILLLAPHFTCYFGITLVNKYVHIFPKLCLWGVLLKTNKQKPTTHYAGDKIRYSKMLLRTVNTF